MLKTVENSGILPIFVAPKSKHEKTITLFIRGAFDYPTSYRV
jgi:hypothetical protein